VILTKEIRVAEMHCDGCETMIEEAVHQCEGIVFVQANWRKGIVRVRFDAKKTCLALIREACAARGYPSESLPDTGKQRAVKIALSLLALTGLCGALLLARKSGRPVGLPELNSQTGDGMIFIVGLLSGLHCVGMCGSFVIGYTARDAEQGRSLFRSHLWYGAGKTLSYALFGAFFGFVGSAFHITPGIGAASIGIAGVFLILYGLNVLNIFSALKAIRIKPLAALMQYAMEKRRRSRSPFFIGLFSGFILGCGPLQVLYVMAAGNGSALEGAKFLTLFGLGTLPALLGFGLLARLLSNSMTRRFTQASGVILIVMGAMMLNKGLMQVLPGGDSESVQPTCSCLK